MKITYIHHSSFLVELHACYLLFDYFQGDIPKLDREKKLYVFSSHRHGDHFAPVVFDLREPGENVSLIFSDDIPRKQVPEKFAEQVIWVREGESLTVDAMKIETYRSTDEGVAFFITCEGKQIYHAGDLNNWWWEGESKDWNHNMSANYKRELEKMTGRKADLAFLPLDPRQEQWFYLGMDQFLHCVQAKVVFPMHFWGNYGIIEKMKALDSSAGYRDHIVSIHREGEEFNYDI